MNAIGIIAFIVIAAGLISGFYRRDTLSYRMGKGLGNRTRQLGEWIMKD